MEEDSTPEFLYKILSREQWEESLLQHRLVISEMDREFIHLAKENQVERVIQKFWNHQEYVLLKVVPKKIVGRLIYETNSGGTTKFYHLYEGNIPLEAVEIVKGK